MAHVQHVQHAPGLLRSSQSGTLIYDLGVANLIQSIFILLFFSPQSDEQSTSANTQDQQQPSAAWHGSKDETATSNAKRTVQYINASTQFQIDAKALVQYLA